MRAALILFILLVQVELPAQIIAGSISPGMIVSDPGINLVGSTFATEESGLIDLDCDGLPDLKIAIEKGAPWIDLDNTASLYVLNSTFKIGADTNILGTYEVFLFNAGDTIDYPDTLAWMNSSLGFSCFGTFICYGSPVITNKYFAWYNTLTSEFGWINVSYDISSTTLASITFDCNQVLSPCTTTAVPVIPPASDCSIFTYSYLVNDVSCYGTCDGQIIISGSGITQYSIDGGVTIVPSNTFTGLCEGTYLCVIMNSIGEQCYFEVVVGTNYPLIITSSSVTNLTCNGSCDGEISVLCSGGSAPYTYTWSGGGWSPTLTGLCAGTYSFCCSDIMGCTVCSTFTVTEPAPLEFTFTGTPLACDSMLYCFFVTGGNPPYQYSLDCGAFLFSPACISGIPFGPINPTVVDANGCTNCSYMVINSPDTLEIITTTLPASCDTCCNGSINMLFAGGVPPYLLTWLGSVPDTANSCPGMYTYCLTDSLGCEKCDSLLVSYTLGATAIAETLQFYLSPNPCTNQIQLIFQNKLTEIDIEIKTVEGKTLFNQSYYSENKITIPTQNWDPGIYLVKTSSRNYSSVNKLVKQ